MNNSIGPDIKFLRVLCFLCHCMTSSLVLPETESISMWLGYICNTSSHRISSVIVKKYTIADYKQMLLCVPMGFYGFMFLDIVFIWYFGRRTFCRRDFPIDNTHIYTIYFNEFWDNLHYSSKKILIFRYKILFHKL